MEASRTPSFSRFFVSTSPAEKIVFASVPFRFSEAVILPSSLFSNAFPSASERVSTEAEKRPPFSAAFTSASPKSALSERFANACSGVLSAASCIVVSPVSNVFPSRASKSSQRGRSVVPNFASTAPVSPCKAVQPEGVTARRSSFPSTYTGVPSPCSITSTSLRPRRTIRRGKSKRPSAPPLKDELSVSFVAFPRSPGTKALKSEAVSEEEGMSPFRRRGAPCR